jgi:hypothetical protein
MDLLTEQKQYLQARLKECEQRPVLNTFLQQVLERHIAKINSSTTFEEYSEWVSDNGNYFDLSQADQQDRYSNFIKIQQFYKNKKREEYYSKKLEVVNQATNHNNLAKNLTDIESEISGEEKKSWQAMQELLNLYLKIVEYITAPDTKKNKHLAEVREKWTNLKQYDPEINLEKILKYQPYRHISIFEDERIIELFSNIREVMQ